MIGIIIYWFHCRKYWIISIPIKFVSREIQPFLLGYSTVPSAFLIGLEYKTLSKPLVSMFGLVIRKLSRKKPPNKITRKKVSGDNPISENANANNLRLKG